MAGLSTYLETAVLAWLKGGAMPSPPAATWLALWSGDPGDAATGGTEVTSTLRPAGRIAAGFGAASGGVIANAASIDFGTAAGSGSVSHIALFDAASGGNLLLSGPLSGGARAVAAGVQVSIGAGDLTIQLS